MEYLASLKLFVVRISKQWWSVIALLFGVYGFYGSVAPLDWPRIGLQPTAAFVVAIAVILVACFLVFHEDQLNMATLQRDITPEPDMRLDEVATYLMTSSIWIKRLREIGGVTLMDDDLRNALHLGRLTAFGRRTDHGQIPAGYSTPFEQLPASYWSDHRFDLAIVAFGGTIDNCTINIRSRQKAHYDIHLSSTEVKRRWRPLTWWERMKYPPAKGGFVVATVKAE